MPMGRCAGGARVAALHYHAGHGSREAFVAARTLTDHAKDRAVAHEVGSQGLNSATQREVEMGDEKPTVLFVYYSFTKQTEMVVDAMAQELTTRGCTVTVAPLEFPDAHYGGRFSKLPMPWSILHIVAMLVPQRRRK